MGLTGHIQKEREGNSPASGELEFVEVPLPTGGARNGSDSGISLHAIGFEIQVTCDFDQATLLNVCICVSPQSPPCQKSGEQNFWSCFFAFECVRTDFSSLTGKR